MEGTFGCSQQLRDHQRGLQSRLFCAHFFIGRQAWKGHLLLQQTQGLHHQFLQLSRTHSLSVQYPVSSQTPPGRAEPLALKRAHKVGQAGAVSLSKGMLNPCPPWGSLRLPGADEMESSTTAACSLDQTMKGGKREMKLTVLGQALSVPSQEVNPASSSWCGPVHPDCPKDLSGEITKTLPRSVQVRRPAGVDEVERQAGESQNPTCNPEHTCDTHWFPNFRTCLVLPVQTWVQAPAHGHVVQGEGTSAAWVEVSPTPSAWECSALIPACSRGRREQLRTGCWHYSVQHYSRLVILSLALKSMITLSFGLSQQLP